MRVKYNRVSTLNQSGERFKVDESGYDKVILDKVSGTIPFKERNGGKEIQSLVQKGVLKELVLEELSRCGRNTGDVITTLSWLDENGVNVSGSEHWIGVQTEWETKPHMEDDYLRYEFSV
jgi:DNA invertase Pin-like site-specific DNA recombinase